MSTTITQRSNIETKWKHSRKTNRTSQDPKTPSSQDDNNCSRRGHFASSISVPTGMRYVQDWGATNLEVSFISRPWTKTKCEGNNHVRPFTVRLMSLNANGRRVYKVAAILLAVFPYKTPASSQDTEATWPVVPHQGKHPPVQFGRTSSGLETALIGGVFLLVPWPISGGVAGEMPIHFKQKPTNWWTANTSCNISQREPYIGSFQPWNTGSQQCRHKEV